jgi:hypothetical protein
VYLKRTVPFVVFCFWLVLLLPRHVSALGSGTYPESWAPIESKPTSDGCPGLEGTFSNRGTGSFPAELGEPPKLTDIFARMARGTGPMSPKARGRVWSVPAEANSVAIVQAPESLSVSFIDQAQNQTPLNFRRYHFSWSEERYDDLFTCYTSNNDPRLRFFVEPESHSALIPNIYMEGGGTLVFLRMAADGSLIVEWRSDSIAISAVVVGSGITFNNVWWRYPPLTGAQ